MTFEESLGEATKRFGRSFTVNEEVKAQLLEDYEAIVGMDADGADIISVETEIDEETMEVSVTADCNEFSVIGSEHTLYEVASRAKRMEIAKGQEDGSMAITFVFPGIWERA